jgi:hypothetical protein
MVAYSHFGGPPLSRLRVLCVIGLIVGSTIRPATASAQLTAAIEGSGSRVSYEGGDGLSVLVVRPVLEWFTPSLSIAADGGLAQFAGGGWSLQGSAAGSWFTPLFSRFRGELAIATVGSTHQDGTTAGEVLGRGRIHWFGTYGGAWLGGALGRAWNGIEWQADRRADAGLWLHHSDLTVTGSATPTWLAGDLQFLDAEVTASLAHDPLELTAFTGTRNWSRPDGVAGTSWVGGSAVLWVAPRLAMVAAAGSYPTDYAQGLPAGRYLSLGVRIASRRSGRDTPAPMDARLPAAAKGLRSRLDAGRPVSKVSAFEVHPSGGGQHTFLMRAPAANRVELIGDFTSWEPVPLTRLPDGTWSVTLAVDAGLHRMNVRVDEGPWGVPAGLTAVGDDFGGTVGVLEIARP